jgi:hypothetical protein
VKLEYFGDQWEETTASETARQWTHHYIRPYDPIILVARWNVFSSRLLCTERRDIQKLLPPGTNFLYASLVCGRVCACAVACVRSCAVVCVR